MEVRKGRTNRLLKSSRRMEEERRAETSRVDVFYIFFVCYVCCHGSRPGSAVVPPNKASRGVPTAAFLACLLPTAFPSAARPPFHERRSPGNLLAFFFVLPLRGHAKTDNVLPVRGGVRPGVLLIRFSRCCPTPSHDSVPALKPRLCFTCVLSEFPAGG